MPKVVGCFTFFGDREAANDYEAGYTAGKSSCDRLPGTLNFKGVIRVVDR